MRSRAPAPRLYGYSRAYPFEECLCLDAKGAVLDRGPAEEMTRLMNRHELGHSVVRASTGKTLAVARPFYGEGFWTATWNSNSHAGSQMGTS